MGLWPAEASVTLSVVGFSTGLLALVPHCVVLSCYMLSCKTCETEQHYYNLL